MIKSLLISDSKHWVFLFTYCYELLWVISRIYCRSLKNNSVIVDFVGYGNDDMKADIKSHELSFANIHAA